MSDIPEGFEPAEVSDAKNLVLDLLHERSDLDAESSDFIEISDEIVERLIATGIGKRAIDALADLPACGYCGDGGPLPGCVAHGSKEESK